MNTHNKDFDTVIQDLEKQFNDFWLTLDESKLEDSLIKDYLKLFAEKCWLNGRRSIHESLT